MKSGLKHFVRCLCPATKADMTRILMKVSELKDQLDALNTQLAKATKEIQDEIANFASQVANLDLPPEAIASLDALKAKVAVLDDLNPDQPPPPPAQP